MVGLFAMMSDDEAHAETLPPPSPGTSKHAALPPDEDPAIGASGEAFARSLPEHPGPERESRIFSAVVGGDAMVRWSFVSAEAGGHQATIPVMARALSIGPPGDSWRITCTYRTAQKIADELSCVMLTPRVADLIFLQSDIQLSPLNRPPWVVDGTMGLTSRSIEQSKALDTMVPADDAGLVANEGKHWVVSARLFTPLGFDPAKWNAPQGVLGSKHNGPNYGWHQRGSGKPLQSVGLAHDMSHQDYSQMVVLMSRRIVVDGEEMNVEDVLRHPEFWKLLSSEGPLPSAVHPDLA